MIPTQRNEAEARKIMAEHTKSPLGEPLLYQRIAEALDAAEQRGAVEAFEEAAKIAETFKISDKALLYKYEEFNDLCGHIANAIRRINNGGGV